MAELGKFMIKMRMEPKVAIVWAEDWEALYVDGVKKAEGHSLSTHHVLTALGFDHTDEEIDMDEDDDPEFAENYYDLKLKRKKK